MARTKTSKRRAGEEPLAVKDKKSKKDSRKSKGPSVPTPQVLKGLIAETAKASAPLAPIASTSSSSSNNDPPHPSDPVDHEVTPATDPEVVCQEEMEVTHPKLSLNPFVICLTEEYLKIWNSEAPVLMELQRHHSRLEVVIRRSLRGQSLLTPSTERAAAALASMDMLAGKKIKFFQLGDKPKAVNAILIRVPTYLPEDLLLSASPNLLSVTRMTKWSPAKQEVVATTTVKVLWSGKSIPKKVTLGFLGDYYTKPFNPPPNQCFRCLRFGHVAIACKAESARCRLCGESHATERCHQKKVANQEVVIKCANCRGPHPASSMRCPKRKEVARIIAVGPVALLRPKTAKPAPPKAAEFPPLIKKTPAQQASVRQAQKPVQQKVTKPTNQSKAPNTKVAAPIKEPATAQTNQPPLENAPGDLEPFYRSRAAKRNAKRREKARMEKERMEQAKLARESARIVTTLPPPPPPQNPPSASSSLKTKAASQKESLQKKAPVKEASATAKIKVPTKSVKPPPVVPPQRAPEVQEVSQVSHVLPLTPRGDHLDLALIEEMEMENSDFYQQQEQTPRGQAGIIRAIVLALKEQLKIAQRLMDMALEDRRVMPLVAKIYSTTQLNLDLVLEELL